MGTFNLGRLMDKQTQVVLFSSTAIALYGYDQGKLYPPSLPTAPLPARFPLLDWKSARPTPSKQA